MKTLLALAVLASLAASAQAAPVLNLNWNSCIGPVDRCLPAGTGRVALYVSAIGQSAPHAGYRYVLRIDDPSPLAVADAWRFDAVGCEGPALIDLNYTSPAALGKSCPTFEGPAAQHNVDSYVYDPVNGSCELTMGSGYAAGNFTAVNPATRYMLGEVVLDFSFAVNGPGDPGNTCGGLERPVGITIVDAFWVDTAFQQQSFAIASPHITANGDCAPTPAHPVTWGAIRAQYR
jgi:hypothetical protein